MKFVDDDDDDDDDDELCFHVSMSLASCTTSRNDYKIILFQVLIFCSSVFYRAAWNADGDGV